MTTRFLNRTMLAATIGAALALGSFAPGEARAAQGYAHHEQDAAKAKDEKARKERAAERQQAATTQRAQVQASVNERQAAIDARVDRHRTSANIDLREQNRIDRNNAAMQNQARVDANERDARMQAQARADANARNARYQRELSARERGDARVSPRPNGRAIERSPIHSTIAAQPGVPYGQLVSAERHRINDERQAEHHDRNRVSDAQRQAIANERMRNDRYRDYLAQREQLALRRTYDLQRSNRLAQYRYQQQYYDRLRQQQLQMRDSRYDWYSDPYIYSQPSYRYYRSGNSYSVNRYAADMLREAVRLGYQEGYRAGNADEQDGWRYDYRDSFAYQDANYGYMGYYVDRSEYNYYFREGFRRGYEDGYRRNSQYGRYYNGTPSILDTVLSVILNLRSL